MSKPISQAEFCAGRIIKEGGDVLAFIEYLFLHYSRNWPRATKAKTLQNTLQKHYGEKFSSHRVLNVIRFLSGIGVGPVNHTRAVATCKLEWYVSSEEIAFHVIERLTSEDLMAA